MTKRARTRAAWATLMVCCSLGSPAQTTTPPMPELAAAELKFGDMFKRPIGPRGRNLAPREVNTRWKERALWRCTKSI